MKRTQLNISHIFLLKVNLQILNLKDINHFIVISDVHLRHPEEKLTQLFISTLNSFSHIDAVFLLGDIFDFIAVNSPYFFNLWKNVFQAFKNLRSKGIQVYFIEGNHDFGFEHFKSEFLNSCFNAYGDFMVQLSHPKLGFVQLRHGDDVVCKPNYLKFRKFVKSKIFQKIISILFPGWFMQFIFSRYAKFSRSQDEYRSLDQNFLMNCLENTLNFYTNIHVLIMGHIHILKDCLIKNKVRFLVGPDWVSKPSYLVYDEENEFQRVFVEL